MTRDSRRVSNKSFCFPEIILIEDMKHGRTDKKRAKDPSLILKLDLRARSPPRWTSVRLKHFFSVAYPWEFFLDKTTLCRENILSFPENSQLEISTCLDVCHFLWPKSKNLHSHNFKTACSKKKCLGKVPLPSSTLVLLPPD